MGHTFLGRSRDAAIGVSSKQLKTQFTWECINATVYVVGGALFVAGSVYFLPGKNASIGSWLFIVGSVLWLIVTLHDFVEIVKRKKISWLDFSAAMIYIFGSVLFVLGSVWYLPQTSNYMGANSCFIIGSILFIVGALLNAMQIFSAGSMWNARFLNLVAASYIIGSTMFLTGSVPYLVTLKDESDEELSESFSAWNFIVGSIFFVIGGVVNFYRTYLVIQDELEKADQTGRSSPPVEKIKADEV